MAQRALVDTGVLQAAFCRGDQHHDAGLAIVTAADRGALPELVVIDFVLAETMNALNHLLAPADARAALSMIEASGGFSVMRTGRTVWARGRSLFAELDRLSFVDAIIVASARDRDLPYLFAFDTGFDGLDDVDRVNADVNPYGP